jgi:hypothetical protein
MLVRDEHRQRELRMTVQIPVARRENNGQNARENPGAKKHKSNIEGQFS